MSVVELRIRHNPRIKPDNFYLAPDMAGWSITFCVGARYHSRTFHQDEAAARAGAEVLVREGLTRLRRAPWK